MTYYLAHFSSDTWNAFQKHGNTVMGFPKSTQHRAAKVAAGDVFICYLLKFSGWCGAIEVLEGPYKDDSPIFARDDDRYVVRFRVKPLVVLDTKNAIPIDELWDQLIRTKDVVRSKIGWAWSAHLTTSLVPLDPCDAHILIKRLSERAGHVKPQTPPAA
jgi:hypothetical protein